MTRPLPPGGAELAGERPVPPAHATYRSEVRRKLIHLGTVVLPLAAWLLPPPLPVLMLGGLVAAAFAVELARRRVHAVGREFIRLTGPLLRGHEREHLTGATYLAVAYLLAYLVFPLPVAVAAMLYSGIGDAAAALVGRRFGRHRIRGGKSWEGAAAGFTANLAVGLVIPGIGPGAALVGAAAATLLELLPLPIDDNLRVTLGGGLVLALASGLAFTL